MVKQGELIIVLIMVFDVYYMITVDKNTLKNDTMKAASFQASVTDSVLG